MRMEKVVKTVIFVILCVFILRITEEVLEKKWNYLGDDEDFSRTFNQFYNLDKDSLQAVFLGKVQ